METISDSTLIFEQGNLHSLQGYITIPCSSETEIKPLNTIIPQLTDQVGLLIFINGSATCSQQNKSLNSQLFNKIIDQLKTQTTPIFIALNNQIEPKRAGVGYARKWIMDLACERAHACNKTWISGLDADCSVAPDYIENLNRAFIDNPNLAGFSLGFEHSPSQDSNINNAIISYETHLRYLKLGLYYANFPFYHHTIGSSMAVRASAYKQVGGMNTRMAGEDFYFLQKIMPLGFGSIKKTLVFPDARISYRVPFGTGKAIADILQNKFDAYYHFTVFQYLKELMLHINLLLASPLNTPWHWKNYTNTTAIEYLQNKKIEAIWPKLNANSKTIEARNKKMNQWMSGILFYLLLNKWRQQHPVNMGISEHCKQLLSRLGFAQPTLPILEQLKRAEQLLD